jgi:hypothetical protein
MQCDSGCRHHRRQNDVEAGAGAGGRARRCRRRVHPWRAGGAEGVRADRALPRARTHPRQGSFRSDVVLLAPRIMGTRAGGAHQARSLPPPRRERVIARATIMAKLASWWGIHARGAEQRQSERACVAGGLAGTLALMERRLAAGAQAEFRRLGETMCATNIPKCSAVFVASRRLPDSLVLVVSKHRLRSRMDVRFARQRAVDVQTNGSQLTPEYAAFFDAS